MNVRDVWITYLEGDPLFEGADITYVVINNTGVKAQKIVTGRDITRLKQDYIALINRSLPSNSDVIAVEIEGLAANFRIIVARGNQYTVSWDFVSKGRQTRSGRTSTANTSPGEYLNN